MTYFRLSSGIRSGLSSNIGIASLVFFGIFLLVLGSFFLHSENISAVIPEDVSGDIQPTQLYNLGVLAFMVNKTEDATAYWEKRLTSNDVEPIEQFYLHANLGIVSLGRAKEQNQPLKTATETAQNAIYHLTDALSFAKSNRDISAQERQTAEISLELARKQYNRLRGIGQNQAESDPQYLISKLLAKEEMLIGLLEDAKTAPPDKRSAIAEKAAEVSKSAKEIADKLSELTP